MVILVIYFLLSPYYLLKVLSKIQNCLSTNLGH
nr:MAG TPA: Protein trafficking PGA2 [Caudoviricetes sp.]